MSIERPPAGQQARHRASPTVRRMKYAALYETATTGKAVRVPLNGESYLAINSRLHAAKYRAPGGGRRWTLHVILLEGGDAVAAWMEPRRASTGQG